jgi:hypothetical protein
MIAMLVVFYMFIFVFGLIGSMRGWAKEMLVIFSIILALAFITIIEQVLRPIGNFLASNPNIQFWVRIIIVLLMTYFGYQSPKFSRFAKASERRDRIQDTLLGFFMGLLSGYFVVGTLWSFSNDANYPMLGNFISAAPANISEATQRVLRILPPVWLGQTPLIYVVVVLSFIFVMVVFL